MRRKWYFIAPLAILGIALFITLGGEIVMQLWNWLLPPLFGLPAVTFWQALGLLALCRILFGGLGGRGRGGDAFRHRMEERCARMSPEERERFRAGLRTRLGFDPPAGETKAQ